MSANYGGDADTRLEQREPDPAPSTEAGRKLMRWFEPSGITNYGLLQDILDIETEARLQGIETMAEAARLALEATR